MADTTSAPSLREETVILPRIPTIDMCDAPQREGYRVSRADARGIYETMAVAAPPNTQSEAVASARAEAVAAERERTAPIFAVLEEAAIWHDAQAKMLSKQPPGGDRDWRRMEHAEQAEMLRAIPLDVALTPGGTND